MTKNHLLPLILFCFVSIGLAACSQNDDQREFERRAFTQPEGITEMTVEGRPVEGGDTDPSDWQIAPDFQGLVSFSQPAIGAYPNPVPFNSTLKIDLNIRLDAAAGLEVFAFENPADPLATPIYVDNRSPLPPGVTTININPGSFSGIGGSGASDTFRILIYDGRQNLISYGDVRVE